MHHFLLGYIKLQNTCVWIYSTSYTSKYNSFTDNILLTIDIFMPTLIHLHTLCPSLSTSIFFLSFPPRRPFHSIHHMSHSTIVTHQHTNTNYTFTFFARITLLLCQHLFQAHSMHITYNSSMLILILIYIFLLLLLNGK